MRAIGRRRNVLEMQVDRRLESTNLFGAAGRLTPAAGHYSGERAMYIAYGRGCRVYDLDGASYIDCINNDGSLIHGHGQPQIVRAVANQARDLMTAGLPTDTETDLAQKLCDRLPSVQQVLFCSSGARALELCKAAARAHTGREEVAKIAAPHCADDPALALRVLNANARSLAGVIVNPLDVAVGCGDEAAGFIRCVEGVCRENGALFVSDETIAMRMGVGGAQGRFGYSPDLTIFGAMIGGGLEIGAIGGRRNIMSVFEGGEQTDAGFPAGGVAANPLALVAGDVALELFDEECVKRMEELGEFLRIRLKDSVKRRAVPAEIVGVGSMASIAFRKSGELNGAGNTSNCAISALTRKLQPRGLLVAPSGVMNISSAMDFDDIVEIAKIIDLAFEECF